MGERSAAAVGWVGVAVLLLAAIIVPFLLFSEEIASWAAAFLDDPSRPHRATAWSTATVIALLLASDLFLPVPSSVVSTAAGLLLGPVLGTVSSWVGMTLGCLVAYWVGRIGGRPIVRRVVGEGQLARGEAMLAHRGALAVVLTRSVPVLAEATVIASGAGRMPLRRFLIAAALANLGVSLAYALVGAYSALEQSFGLAFAGAIGLPAVVLGVDRLVRRFPRR